MGDWTEAKKVAFERIYNARRDAMAKESGLRPSRIRVHPATAADLSLDLPRYCIDFLREPGEVYFLGLLVVEDATLPEGQIDVK